MSLNRETKSYRKLIKKIAGDFRYRPTRRLGGIGPYREISVEQVIAEKYADIPTSAIEDALRFLIKDCHESAASFEEMGREERELADRMEEALRAHRRPRLKIIGGAA